MTIRLVFLLLLAVIATCVAVGWRAAAERPFVSAAKTYLVWPEDMGR